MSIEQHDEGTKKDQKKTEKRMSSEGIEPPTFGTGIRRSVM